MDKLDTAGIQPRDLHALQLRDVTTRLGLVYDTYALETSQFALEVDDDKLEANPQQILGFADVVIFGALQSQ